MGDEGKTLVVNIGEQIVVLLYISFGFEYKKYFFLFFYFKYK